jgi:hypothetical protein
MAGFLVWMGGDTQAWLEANTLRRVLWLGGLVAGGGAVYFSSLWLFGARASQFRLQPPAVSAGS